MHNCQVSLGLPATYFGADIDDLLTKNSVKKTLYYDFDGEIGVCHISIETFADEIAFSQEVDESVDILAEGDIELF